MALSAQKAPAHCPAPNASGSALAEGRTHVGDAEEGEEEGGQHYCEGEELPVPVQQLELIDEPGDHRLHPPHLQQTEQGWLQGGRDAAGAGGMLATELWGP